MSLLGDYGLVLDCVCEVPHLGCLSGPDWSDPTCGLDNFIFESPVWRACSLVGLTPLCVDIHIIVYLLMIRSIFVHLCWYILQIPVPEIDMYVR
jgi:hypothetical protein